MKLIEIIIIFVIYHNLKHHVPRGRTKEAVKVLEKSASKIRLKINVEKTKIIKLLNTKTKNGCVTYSLASDWVRDTDRRRHCRRSPMQEPRSEWA